MVSVRDTERRKPTLVTSQHSGVKILSVHVARTQTSPHHVKWSNQVDAEGFGRRTIKEATKIVQTKKEMKTQRTKSRRVMDSCRTLIV